MKIAQELAQTQKSNQQLMQQLRQLQNLSKEQLNPEVQANNVAYTQMDQILTQEMRGLYGEINPHQMQAVSNEMASYIKNMQQTAPQAWQELRSSPQLQQMLIKGVLTSQLPKEVVSRARHEQEMAQPFTREDAFEALQEARDMMNKAKTPEEHQFYSDAATMARQKYLELTYNRGASQPRRR